MKGQALFEVNIQGKISTNSNRESICEWRENIERSFSSLHFPQIARKKIAIEIEFWVSRNRLQIRRNDLDNLVKPVLDSMIKIGVIEDDADIFHLEATKFPTESEEEVHVRVTDWN